MGGYGDGAFIELHSESHPVSSSYLQGLLQNHGRLLPVRPLAKGADADVLVEEDVVPEWNCSYSSCRCGLDLANRNQEDICGTATALVQEAHVPESSLEILRYTGSCMTAPFNRWLLLRPITLTVQCAPYLDLSVSVVRIGIHEVENKELHRLTQTPAL